MLEEDLKNLDIIYDMIPREKTGLRSLIERKIQETEHTIDEHRRDMAVGEW